ncbi:NYN domain-containing protein [Cupriavidus sp. UGS-1]|uniref:NYN domain-containing protein n=1 Tax=Cupriavidus sp. UGS-1 TaxID=2899826 RepID=UPI002105162C|nr:NYN domain-containing protein [Cupriavidus sp. UGS-1]
MRSTCIGRWAAGCRKPARWHPHRRRRTTRPADRRGPAPQGKRLRALSFFIGVDVSSLAFKKQVDQIVLIAGDADFVPAAKQARREGIDFILDPMWQRIPPNLNEHIDGLRSTCPRYAGLEPYEDASRP